jgi:hypothetical protein
MLGGGQQGCVLAPQGPITQVPFWQTLSVWQVLFGGQQTWPIPPHALQVPLKQPNPALQLLPAQQIWFICPQATQVPLTQIAFVTQVLPAQQGWLRSPHPGCRQVPATQSRPGWQIVGFPTPSGQQGWSACPQI